MGLQNIPSNNELNIYNTVILIINLILLMKGGKRGFLIKEKWKGVTFHKSVKNMWGQIQGLALCLISLFKFFKCLLCLLLYFL